MSSPDTIAARADGADVSTDFSRRERRLVRACKPLLDSPVQAIAYPGGRSRDAVSLTLADGREVIAAKRDNRFRAELECRVLRALRGGGAAVPEVLGFDGDKLLLQQLLNGNRLSAALNSGTPEDVERLLDNALTSLASAQQAGTAAALESHVPALGKGRDWIDGLLRRPLVIGGYLQVKPARPRVEQLRKLLAVRTPRFVKWDARSGNAMVDASGEVSWFDWEHCGARNRIDDVAWLLGDEFTPELAEQETRVIDRQIEAFADDMPADQARQYLYAYGVFHAVVRLGLILSRKKDEDWWDFDYCVARDKAGVTLDCALRLVRRGARWADMDVATRPLAAWFTNIGERLHEL